MQAVAMYPRKALHDFDFDAIRIVARLNDSKSAANHEDFRSTWNGFILFYNSLQFLPRVLFLPASGAEQDIHAHLYSAVLQPLQPFPSNAALTELIELIMDQAVRDAVVSLVESGKPAPEVGYELEGSRGGVAAEAEIAWPDQKVAVLVGNQVGYRERFLTRDWNVFVPDEDPKWVETLRVCL